MLNANPGHITTWNDLVPSVQEAGWSPRPVWTSAENLAPTGNGSPSSLLRVAILSTLFRSGTFPYSVLCVSYVSHNKYRFPNVTYLLARFSNGNNVFSVRYVLNLCVYRYICTLTHTHTHTHTHTQCIRTNARMHTQRRTYPHIYIILVFKA